MITLRALSQDNPDILLVKELYIQAFPLRERLDLRSLFEVMPATLWGIYTDRETRRFAGFFIVIEDQKLVFLHYFATNPEVYTADLRQQALQALRKRYRERPLMVVYERIGQESDDGAQRQRRRTFYLHNGFHDCPWYALYGDTQYGMASTTESVNDTVMEHLLHLYQSFKTNFYTHSN